ncbi:segregation and condensation protein A [Alterisphingorhabdus coralli]|uniref:Segregation and condensation protein A n=1 Tax=Alterisphingorhabdus coralli TaxID=3071408 RepID=A0AA97F5D3_9SPHN|nr:ScpA family protein [Parasphingorhabdus sp. SCSIO 66989]WOE74604.1 ScpA family protein [Parasphingorhabdus sp. SCSIO 66989]
MNEAEAPDPEDSAWEADAPPRRVADSEPEQLQIDVEGWEGPLDVLLSLARNQKVDLMEISILELVRQYLDFINNAEALKLELAADYLVMAAWLTYLKSALLLPKDPEVDPSPEELALQLQLRLQRLQAMRESGARLMARDRMGRDVFGRGAPEGLKQLTEVRWTASLYDLMQGYADVKLRTAPAVHIVQTRPVMSLEEALDRVSNLVGAALDWTELSTFLPPEFQGQLRRSAMASSFVAALELARNGRIELRQGETFGPLQLRARHEATS